VVYSCVRKIATTAPAASLCVEQELGNGQRIRISSRLVNIFKNPNPYLDGFIFQETIHTFLNLIGECFIIKVRDQGVTSELWITRPDRMHPVPLVKSLLGYVYIAADGQRMPFAVDEVIHIKYPNPLDEWEGLGRGLSPLSAAAIEADIDNSSTAFMKDFFSNACVPFGLLKSKHILDDEEVKRVRFRMKEQYSNQSKRSWHELLIIDAEMDYQRMGLKIDEMAFPEIRGLTETRICSVFDVPPILVGVQVGLKNQGAFNETVLKEARKQLWFDKIQPDNKRIAEIFTSSFRDELGDGEVIGHDYSSVQILQEDRTDRFERANQAYQGGWLTQNEARREAGFPDVVDGDKFVNQEAQR
jgi:HK97 family phage portal protein